MSPEDQKCLFQGVLLLLALIVGFYPRAKRFRPRKRRFPVIPATGRPITQRQIDEAEDDR